jgi:hypothetical protein
MCSFTAQTIDDGAHFVAAGLELALRIFGFLKLIGGLSFQE